MINHLLATIDNNPTAPNGFVWPTFTARTVSADEASVRSAVIGLNLSRENHFSRCLQLVNLLQESPLASYETAEDPRVTYTKKSIRARYSASGTIALYQGVNDPSPQANLVLTATMPDMASYVLNFTTPTDCTVADDVGATVARTVSFAGGVSSLIEAPGGEASILLTATAPAAGDKWLISYQKAGASWVTQALQRVERSNPKAIMTPELVHWYDRAILPLDRLAAVVAALGTPE